MSGGAVNASKVLSIELRDSIRTNESIFTVGIEKKIKERVYVMISRKESCPSWADYTVFMQLMEEIERSWHSLTRAMTVLCNHNVTKINKSAKLEY